MSPLYMHNVTFFIKVLLLCNQQPPQPKSSPVNVATSPAAVQQSSSAIAQQIQPGKL